MELNIKGLTKRYGKDHLALDNVDLSIGPGVFGLLGPNGAGKTTLMNIVATLSKATAGSVEWNGEDMTASPNALRKVLGYLPQDFGIYPNLTAQEFLEYLAAVKGMTGASAKERIPVLLDLVNLTAAKDRALSGYSGGMRQRIGIAQALLNDPQLLIVDEPTVGLDPEERIRFRNLVAELATDRIVILSTHIVSDVEMTATDIAILRQGKLLGHRKPEDWISQMTTRVWRWVVPSDELAKVQKTHAVSTAVRRNDGVHLRIVSPDAPSADSVETEATLEDAYMAVMSETHA